MREMPDKSVDLVLTDPPYGIGMNRHFGNAPKERASYISKDNWDKKIPSREIFEQIDQYGKTIKLLQKK